MVRIGIIGGGLIGAGWAALFAHSGHDVRVFDPDGEVPDRLRKACQDAKAILEPSTVGQDTLPVHVTSKADLAPVDFVQECLPENLALKRRVLAEIEPHLAQNVPIASSTSGFAPAEIAGGLARPERVLIGHPCNPPYLMPVVELLPGPHTAPETVSRVASIYESAGRRVLRLNRSVPGHLVNRLQAALWREMLHLWQSDVACLEVIGEAVTRGLAPRWTILSPTDVFQVSGSDAGMAGFCASLGSQMDRWWQDLGCISFDPQLASALIDETRGIDAQRLVRRRDAGLPKILESCANAAAIIENMEETNEAF